MKVYDLSTLADGILREQAVTKIKSLSKIGFPDPKKWGRNQMKNLQHIARVSPLQVSNYAKHQREKLPKDKDKNIKASHQGIASVWQAVIDCCQLTKNSDTGSLEKEGRKYWDTTWLVLDSPLPQGAKIEDRQHRKQLSGARKEFQERWLSETVPVFFDFFCIEYVFQITHSSVQEI